MKKDPVHRSLVAVDIEGYSRRRNPEHLRLRDGLRQIMADSFDGVGIEICPEEQQDQGDGFLTLVKPEVSKVILLDGFVRAIENALRRFNHFRPADEKMRLRIALHSGELHIDGPGFPGEATITVMRLIDAEAVKKALAHANKDLAIIVSESLHRDVVVHGYDGILPEEYCRVKVSIKEFKGHAWVRVPGCLAEEIATIAATTEPSTHPAGGTDSQPKSKPQAEQTNSFNNVHFKGTTSFGGYAAGRDINVNGTSD